jgi:hypothetical protein
LVHPQTLFALFSPTGGAGWYPRRALVTLITMQTSEEALTKTLPLTGSFGKLVMSCAFDKPNGLFCRYTTLLKPISVLTS